MTRLIPDNDDFDRRLHVLAESLEVPPSAYEQARARYDAVGRWLCADDSPLAPFNPIVYAQGSFALGTVIRPYNRTDYDVDAVIQLDGSPRSWEPARLKQSVGARLRDHATYARMLRPEGRRCWTLEYASADDAPGFHMDLLPCVLFFGSDAIGVAGTATAISLTHRDTPVQYTWRASDPKAYQTWFKDRMAQELGRILKQTRADIEAVPAQSMRTTLQITVQILKRHRDIMFKGDENTPISIIITTLAARAYDGDASLADAFVTITKGMRGEIEWVGGRPVVRNPVRPEENFADRWEADPAKRTAFFAWLDAVERLAEEIGHEPSDELPRPLTVASGESVAKTATRTYAPRPSDDVAPMVPQPHEPSSSRASAPMVRVAAAPLVPALWQNATHRQGLAWPEAPGGAARVRLVARVVGRGDHQDGGRLSPAAELEFVAIFEEEASDEVRWQIVNTGPQARSLGELRGTFEYGRTRRRETALYLGDHFIECFVIRRGSCVGRSGPFIVRVR